MVQQTQVGGGVQAVALFQELGLYKHGLYFFVALFGQLNLAQLFIYRKVAGFRLGLLAQARNQFVHRAIQLRAVFGGARNNERRARLVNQDGVHLVNNGKGQLTLGLIGHIKGHVVAQIIKAKLVVGAIDNVTGVGGALIGCRLARVNHPHGHTQKLVQRPHPTGVAGGQIVVHRYQMHAVARQRIEVGRQCGHQSLTFTGAHLGNLALV